MQIKLLQVLLFHDKKNSAGLALLIICEEEFNGSKVRNLRQGTAGRT